MLMEVDLELTPAQLAEKFCQLGDEDMAAFFGAIGTIQDEWRKTVADPDRCTSRYPDDTAHGKVHGYPSLRCLFRAGHYGPHQPKPTLEDDSSSFVPVGRAVVARSPSAARVISQIWAGMHEEAEAAALEAGQ